MLEPSVILVEIILAGLLLRRRGLVWFGAGLLAAAVVLPVGNWAIRPLEDRFPAIKDPPSKVDGIILLGGAIDDLTSEDRQTPALNNAANRITTFVILSRLYPDARLVFTGGSGSVEQGVATEAPWVRILVEQLGVAPGRVIFEGASRTTWENAVEVGRLVHPKPGETWVLLTSAAHLPRAVGVFRAAGWSVLPWPVGYRSRDHISGWFPSFGVKLAMLDNAGHEWMGLLAYWLQGRSSALFPAP